MSDPGLPEPSVPEPSEDELSIGLADFLPEGVTVAAEAPALDGIERDLDAVDAAIAALDAGTYGIDAATGEPIADELLAEDPTRLS